MAQNMATLDEVETALAELKRTQSKAEELRDAIAVLGANSAKLQAEFDAIKGSVLAGEAAFKTAAASLDFAKG